MNARIKSPITDLLRSELKKAIYEANLGRNDTHIADRYYIDRAAQIDIAVEMGYERSTISRRIKQIEPRIINAARKLKYIT